MIIQCHHCHATYKIDPQKIPNKKAFVRCAKCSNSIPVSATEQKKEAETLPKKLVHCDSCHIRYAIPLSRFTQDSITVRCGKCGHLFDVNKEDDIEDNPAKEVFERSLNDSESNEELSEEEAPPPNIDSIADEDKSEDDESFPESDFGSIEKSEFDRPSMNDHAPDLETISIPKENEIQVDNLFDDFDNSEEEETNLLSDDQELDNFPDPEDLAEDFSEDFEKEKKEEKKEDEATERYLESVSLSDDTSTENSEFNVGTISSEQKYKFFLQPKSGEEESVSEQEEEESWPEIQDETEPSTVFEAEGIPFEEEEPEFESETVSSLDEMADYSRMEEKKSSNKKVLLFISLIALILAGAISWFVLNRDTSGENVGKDLSKGKVLSIIEPLSGKLIKNRYFKKNLFLLEGEVKNPFPATSEVGNVAILGKLYNQKNEIIATSRVIAGNTLSLKQLKGWKQKKIERHLKAEGSDKDEAVYQEKIPFQILFFKTPDNIQTMGASIYGYKLDGITVDGKDLKK